MGGISDVDTTALAEALKHPDLSAIMLEARKLKVIGLSLIHISWCKAKECKVGRTIGWHLWRTRYG